MKILLDLQNSMRAVTLNSEFSLCGLKLVWMKILVALLYYLAKIFNLENFTILYIVSAPFSQGWGRD